MAFLDSNIVNIGRMTHDLYQTDELMYEGT